MEALRIKLKQNKAIFSKEETVENKMTYPLPPYSTVIGAIHNTCDYEDYHPMDISIQGNYETMAREMYIDNGMLNNRENDRNILIYLHNPNLLSAGYIKIGEGLKKQNNNFKKNITVRIDNRELHERYIELCDLKDKMGKENREIIKPKGKELQVKINEIKYKLKKIDKKSEEYREFNNKIKNIRREKVKLIEDFKERKDRLVDLPLNHFQTLAKSPRYQEILHNLNLVLHIKAESQILEDIKDNINNFISLGRSEDFVEVNEIKIVDLIDPDREIGLKDNNKIYVNIDRVDRLNTGEKAFLFADGTNKKEAKGTVYFLNKNYEIKDNKRIFTKIPCLYSSYLVVDEESKDVKIDEDGYLTDFN